MPTGRSLGSSIFRHLRDCQTVRFFSNEVVGSAGFDGHFRVWDVPNGKRLCSWSIQGEELYAIDRLSETRFVVAGLKGKVYFLEQVGIACRVLKEVEVEGWVSHVVVCRSKNVLAVACSTGKVVLLDLGDAEKVIRTKDFKNQICGLQWLEKQNKLLVGCNDGTVWRMELNEKRSKLMTHEGTLEHVEMSETAETMFLFGKDVTVTADDIVEKHTVLVCAEADGQWKVSGSKLLPNSSNTATGTCSPDGSILIVIVDREVLHIEVPTLNVKRQFTLTDLAARACFSPDGRLHAVGSCGAVFHCWTSTGDEIYSPTGHTDGVARAEFSLTNSSLYTAAIRPNVIEWNLSTLAVSKAFSLNGISLLGFQRVNDDKCAVALWNRGGTDFGVMDIETGDVKTTFDYPEMRRLRVVPFAGELCVATFGRGRYSTDGFVELRHLESGKLRFRLDHDGMEIRDLDLNDSILICCGEDHLWMWQLAKRPVKKEWEVPFSAGLLGLRFLSADHILVISETQVSRLNLKTQQWSAMVELPAEVTAFAIDDTRQLIAIGYVDGTIEVRKCLEPEMALQAWQAHEGVRISVVAFDHQTQQLATGAGDGTLFVWTDFQ